MRMTLAALAALLLASGCDRRPETPSTAAPIPAPPPAPAPGPMAPADVPPPGGAAVVVLVDADGARTATLSCGTRGLQIIVPRFRRIASEERLSLGTEGEAFALVADLAAPGSGVTASGAPDPDLLDRMARGEALFGMYGQQSVGPLTASSPAALQTVISACRRRE